MRHIIVLQILWILAYGPYVRTPEQTPPAPRDATVTPAPPSAAPKPPRLTFNLKLGKDRDGTTSATIRASSKPFRLEMHVQATGGGLSSASLAAGMQSVSSSYTHEGDRATVILWLHVGLPPRLAATFPKPPVNALPGEFLPLPESRDLTIVGQALGMDGMHTEQTLVLHVVR